MKTDILFVTVNTVGGGAERMMFNIIGTLRSSLHPKLLITSNERVPVEAPQVEAINLNKKHAYSTFFSIIHEILKHKPRYLFTTSSSIGYILVVAKYLNRGFSPKVFIRCAVPPTEMYSRSLKSRILRQVIKFTYNGADLVIAQTDYMRNDLINSYKLKGDKVKTIRNIVDAGFLYNKASEQSDVNYQSDSFNIIAAGALYSVKGFDLLITAFAEIANKRMNATLTIIGAERYEDGYSKKLQLLIEQYTLCDRIKLAGHKSNPYPYIKNADLLVMSSRKEGYPNVVLEALTLGTPVIATNVVDWSGVIKNGCNGYIVEKGSVKGLASAIDKAIEKPLNAKSVVIENFDYNSLFV